MVEFTLEREQQERYYMNADYSQYKEQPAESGDKLQQISFLADRQRDIELEITRLDDLLKAEKLKLAKVAETELPALMDELELDEITTKSGLKVKVKENIRAQISEERNPAAIAWLEEHGFSNLVRREFVILFNREDSAWANKFQGDMKKRKKQLNVKRKQTVNPSTLKSWVSHELEKGEIEDFPEELFGVFKQRVSKVEVPKVKKARAK